MAATGDQRDRVGEVIDGVAGAHLGRVGLGEGDRRVEAMESVGLIGPDARLEPARRVGVGDDRPVIGRGRSAPRRGEPRGNGDVATRAHTRAPRATGHRPSPPGVVPVLVAIEEQLQTAAASRRRRVPAGRPRRRRGRGPAGTVAHRPTSLVWVDRVAEQVGEALLVLGAELSERRHSGSVGMAAVGREVRIVARRARCPGSSRSSQCTQANSSTGSCCCSRRVEQQSARDRIVGDALGEVAVERRPGGRADGKRPEPLSELICRRSPCQPY